jgi:predicted dehydrogenase
MLKKGKNVQNFIYIRLCLKKIFNFLSISNVYTNHLFISMKYAIIGLGKRALEYYMPAVKIANLCELVAICDIDHSKKENNHKIFDVNYYYNFYDLIASEKLDFIIISTPHNTHREIIKLAARHKIHILKEKPFALNLQEAFEIRNLCTQNKIYLMNILQRRLDPIYQKFFDYINKIGEVFFIEIKYTIIVDNLHEGWRSIKEEAGGGCIIDMGYHMIDLIIWYFGLPDKIHAEFSSRAKPKNIYDVEDTASILFSYNNALHGSLIISRYYPPKSESIKIIGSNGTIEISRDSITVSDGKIIDKFHKSDVKTEFQKNPIDYFSQVINSNYKNIGSPEYHLEHMSFIESCYFSQKMGKYVSPKELLKEHE